MAEAPTFTLPTGQTVRLGYRKRPFDPASVKYAWTNFARAAAVDLTQPRLYWGSAADPRLPILNQGQIGSCSSFGAADAATEAERMQGAAAVELMHDWLYERARQIENTWPADAGSDPADILDLCRQGAPPESAQAGGYVDNPSEDFSQYTPQATLRYVASFHAIFPADQPNLQTLVWQALDAGYPVTLAMGWTPAFGAPQQGILPSGQTPAQEVGGHCIRCYGICPGYYLCDNQWGTGWAADAASSGLPGMRPGSFAVPWEYGQPNSLLEVAYAVVGVSAPQPQPQPGPQPVQVDASKPVGSLLAAAMANPGAEPQAGSLTRQLIDYGFQHGFGGFSQAQVLVDWLLDGNTHDAAAIQAALAPGSPAGWLAWLRGKGAA